jgi:hypothetical protein
MPTEKPKYKAKVTLCFEVAYTSTEDSPDLAEEAIERQAEIDMNSGKLGAYATPSELVLYDVSQAKLIVDKAYAGSGYDYADDYDDVIIGYNLPTKSEHPEIDNVMDFLKDEIDTIEVADTSCYEVET